MRKELNKSNFDTDKSKNYLSHYERYFSKFKDNKTKLLELGVYKGGSLLMWGEYFEKGTIVGIDIDDPQIELPENVYFEKGDQRDKDFLQIITKKYAKRGFDIIIDDASHFANFTEASFLICFMRLLKPGGIYVIEDWGTGYWEDWPDGKSYVLPENHIIKKLRKEYSYSEDYENPQKTNYNNHSIGMVGLIKQLVDELAIGDIKRSNETMTGYESAVDSMFFSTGQVLIFKKKNKLF